MLRSLHLRRAVLCLGLVGLLGLASGCEETAGPTATTDPNNNPGVDSRKAREAAYGPAGVPVGKPAQTAKTPAK